MKLDAGKSDKWVSFPWKFIASISKCREIVQAKTMRRLYGRYSWGPLFFSRRFCIRESGIGAIKVTRHAIHFRIDHRSFGLMGVMWNWHVLQTFQIKKRKHCETRGERCMLRGTSGQGARGAKESLVTQSHLLQPLSLRHALHVLISTRRLLLETFQMGWQKLKNFSESK